MQINRRLLSATLLSLTVGIFFNTQVLLAQDTEDEVQPEQTNTEVRTPRQTRENGLIMSDEARQQTLVSQLAQRIVSHLEKMRSRIQNHMRLDDDTKARMINQLNEYIAWVRSTAATIDRSNEVSSLREQIFKLKNYWEESQQRLLLYVAQIRLANVENAIERFEALDVKISILLQRLESAGSPNLETMQAIKNQFDAEIVAARNAYTEAKRYFTELEDNVMSSNAPRQYEEGMTKLRESYEELRSARQSFKNLLRSVKNALPKRLGAPSNEAVTNEL